MRLLTILLESVCRVKSIFENSQKTQKFPRNSKKFPVELKKGSKSRKKRGKRE
jgi:hypothetical protein